MTEHVDFSLALHRALAGAPSQPFCWSPYSVASALGLAATAAGGETRRELLAALRAESPEAAAEPLSAAAEPDTSGPGEEPVLAVANTLWAHEELGVRAEFRDRLAAWPGAAVRTTPFRTAPEDVRRRINADVAETTRELIPELLDPGTVDPDTVAALVNALYLKVAWREAFDPQATAEQPFRAPSGSREVPTMTATRRMGHAAAEGWQAVVLPAAGGVEAAVLLPDDELERAEPALDAPALGRLLDAVQQQRVELHLPRFTATGAAELRGPLGELGVRSMFTGGADFSPLADEPMEVSTVVHRAVLEVDESGLEGAAATAAMMRLTAIVQEPDPLVVRVDRPFLFLVRHRASGALYFLARVVDPS